MNRAHHLIIVSILMILVIAIGTAGYMAIEGWDLTDSLYMAVITLTTVGYGEIHKVSKAGQIFTIFFIFTGVGISMYVLGAVVQFVIEGRIQQILGRRRVDKKILQLSGHYIVCGYGRIGQVLCKKMTTRHKELVIIENDAAISEVLDKDTLLHIIGDATDESILLKAGIKQAAGLVAALGTDTKNVFLVLTARQLNPSIYIMARASHHTSKSKLTAAGANQVEFPYDIGAARMAQRILRPTVTSFLDMAFTHHRKDIQMEEFPVGAHSPLADVMLKASGIRQNYNLIIIAIKKDDDTMMFNPSFDTILRPGDTLVAVGEEANLKKLEKILLP